MAAAELVDEVLKSFRPRLSESGISVQFEMSPELPFVCVDQRAMTLALANLIENAIRHVRNNGHIRISINTNESIRLIEIRMCPLFRTWRIAFSMRLARARVMAL